MSGLTAEQIERLGIHTPVWDHDGKGFTLECGCGEFTHYGVTRAEAEQRFAEHLAPVVAALIAEAVEQARADIAAAMTEEMADRVEWGDGTGYINTADAARIARGEVTP